MRGAGVALSLVVLAAAPGALAAPAQGEVGGGPSVLDEPGQKARGNTPPKEEDEAISYSGLGLSKVSSTFDNVDDAINLDAAFGFNLPWIPWLGAELAGSFTVVPGDYKGEQRCTTTGPSPPPPLGTGDPGTTTCEEGNFTRSTNGFQMTNVGAFAVVRSPGIVYGLAKYGYRMINASIPEIQDGDDVAGTAWTLGGGVRWAGGLAAGELAYTEYSSQIDYFGFNIAYGFGASPGRGAR